MDSDHIKTLILRYRDYQIQQTITSKFNLLIITCFKPYILITYFTGIGIL